MEYPTIRKRRTRELVPKIHSQFAAFFRYRCRYISPPTMFVNGSTQLLLQQNVNAACKLNRTVVVTWHHLNNEKFIFSHRMFSIQLCA